MNNTTNRSTSSRRARRTIFIVNAVAVATTLMVLSMLYRIFSSMGHYHSDPSGRELCAGVFDGGYYLRKGAHLWQVGNRVGEINYPVYIEPLGEGEKDSLALYAWVWSASVSPLGAGQVTLRVGENLREASNRRIFAHLIDGARAYVLYENAKKSWQLLRFGVEADSGYVTNRRPHWWSSDPVKPVTHSGGGDFPDERGMR